MVWLKLFVNEMLKFWLYVKVFFYVGVGFFLKANSEAWSVQASSPFNSPMRKISTATNSFELFNGHNLPSNLRRQVSRDTNLSNLKMFISTG